MVAGWLWGFGYLLAKRDHFAVLWNIEPNLAYASSRDSWKISVRSSRPPRYEVGNDRWTPGAQRPRAGGIGWGYRRCEAWGVRTSEDSGIGRWRGRSRNGEALGKGMVFGAQRSIANAERGAFGTMTIFGAREAGGGASSLLNNPRFRACQT